MFEQYAVIVLIILIVIVMMNSSKSNFMSGTVTPGGMDVPIPSASNKYCTSNNQYTGPPLLSKWPFFSRPVDYYDNSTGYGNKTQYHTDPLMFEYGGRTYDILPF